MKYVRLLAFFVLAILVISTLGLFAGESVPAEENLKNQRIPHAPIHINGNDDFASQAQQNGWPGNGTPENPYVIEGYEIDGQGGTYCIWIENTTAYFVIRDCYVFNATSGQAYPWSSGIALKNVQNGTITANDVSGNGWGIFLDHAINNNIINNNASGNYYLGIGLASSTYNTIAGNNASGGWYGFYILWYSSNNTITNNNASGNSNNGIWLNLYSSYNTITYNCFCNNAKYGIYITNWSTANTIHHNNFIANNGAGKGVSGKCQAYDEAGGNYWYDATAQQGNYWSNWDGNGYGSASAYPIDGGMACDYYPLSGPVVAELSFMPLPLLLLSVFIGFILLRRQE